MSLLSLHLEFDRPECVPWQYVRQLVSVRPASCEMRPVVAAVQLDKDVPEIPAVAILWSEHRNMHVFFAV